MNISQLEYFVTTIRCGNFSTAARELFVTPQAVSKAVGDLEKELHVQLFEKAGRGIKPTAFGLLFSERASETLACLTDLETMAKNHAYAQMEEGSLSVAIATSACRGNVITSTDFDAFRAAYPKIALDLQYAQSAVCLAALEEGVADAAVILGKTGNSELECIKLLSTTLVIAVAADHPLAACSTVRLKDLARYPIALPEDLRFCSKMLTRHFELHDAEASFCALLPFLSEHQRFLEQEGGAIFVIDDPMLTKLYPRTVRLKLDREEAVRIPLYLAYPASRPNAAISNLERYLISTASLIKKGRRPGASAQPPAWPAGKPTPYGPRRPQAKASFHDNRAHTDA